MDRTKILEAIEVLDREVPRDGARVKLDQYGGDPDESMIVANEAGFLRLGIEFLKAGVAPVQADHVSVDLKYLMVKDSSIWFDWFERREPSQPKPTTAIQHIGAALFLVLMVAAMLLAIFGLATVLGWIRR